MLNFTTNLSGSKVIWITHIAILVQTGIILLGKVVIEERILWLLQESIELLLPVLEALSRFTSLKLASIYIKLLPMPIADDWLVLYIFLR